MKCLPEAYENIIVGLKWRDRFAWYVSVKEMWFLVETIGQERAEQWCQEKCFPLEDAVFQEDERYGIPVLNENTIDAFLPRISAYAAPVDELRDFMKLTLELSGREDAFYTYMPSLYVDFDKKVLYSMYTEPASFEDYVPSHWEGYYQDFLDLIEPEERYWWENGRDLIDFRKGAEEE